MSRIILTISGSNDSIKLDVEHKGKTDDVYVYGCIVADFINILLSGEPQHIANFGCKVAETMESAQEHMDEQEARAANQQNGVSLGVQQAVEESKKETLQ